MTPGFGIGVLGGAEENCNQGNRIWLLGGHGTVGFGSGVALGVSRDWNWGHGELLVKVRGDTGWWEWDWGHGGLGHTGGVRGDAQIWVEVLG